MAVTVTVIPGAQLAPGEALTRAKANQMANPTVSVTGSISATELGDGAVKSNNATPGPYFFAVTGGTVTSSYCTVYTADVGTALRPTSLVEGMELCLKLHADCGSGGCTLNVTGSAGSGLGAKPLVTRSGKPLAAEDLKANQIIWVVYSSSGSGRWEVVSPLAYPSVISYGTAAGTANNVSLSGGTLHPTFTNAAGLIGRTVEFVALNTNTGAMTLSVDGLAPNLKRASGVDVAAGEIIAGRTYQAYHDGTQFVLIASTGKQTQFYLGTLNISGSAWSVTGVANFPTAYVEGITVTWRCGTGGGTNCTLDINGLSAVAIKRPGGFSSSGREFVTGEVVTVVYSNSVWNIVSISPWTEVVSVVIDTNTKSLATVAHGLPNAPQFVQAVIVPMASNDATNGWPQYSEVPIWLTSFVSVGNSSLPAFAVVADNTNVYVDQICTYANIKVPNHTTPSTTWVGLAGASGTGPTWTLKVRVAI